MYQQLRNLTLASAIAVALVSVSSPVFADAAQDLTNARQESQISTSYALSPYLRAMDLGVSVDNGHAVLTGQVAEDVNKDLAAQIALGVKGIKEVDNQIVVQADYAHPERTAERSFGDVVDDASITAAIKNKLLWSKHASGLTTDVDTSWGRVKLKGTAETAAARNAAGSLARNTQGVRSVDNQLVVEAGKPHKDTSAMQDVADAWITMKVKSTFGYSTNVDGSDIQVSTADGVVTLRGTVESGAEQALAIELAGNVRGVKSVVSAELKHSS
ncbi:MAG: BON domain-containing protein [Lysobacterales bacterium]